MDTVAPAPSKVTTSDSVAKHLAYYKSKHRTRGCKITHMIGIPMIAVGWMLLPFNRKAFLQLQVGGWILQFIGHFVFEHNKPVILEVRDPKTVISALIFVYEEWSHALNGDDL
ncbi:MAG TPA: DUF962 domain-containing protein [Drouetiella sp.]